MQAQRKRHIKPGHQFDTLIPQSIKKDVVILGSGKAQLQDTLQLMQQMIGDTTADTALLAQQLKKDSVHDTCRNIWNFVYNHIQYKMDARGIEQVRRPSRTWADRKTGVDCDCYTVFIGSILYNLGIPFTIRITKYGGKTHFQHVYPVVFTNGKQITMDCVTDRFNHEVPYSEKKDIGVKAPLRIKDISGLSGVDSAAITLDALEQPKIPLQEIHYNSTNTHCLAPIRFLTPQRNRTRKSARMVSPYRFKEDTASKPTVEIDDFDWTNFLIVSGISIAAGIGVIKLLTGPEEKVETRSKRPKK